MIMSLTESNPGLVRSGRRERGRDIVSNIEVKCYKSTNL